MSSRRTSTLKDNWIFISTKLTRQTAIWMSTAPNEHTAIPLPSRPCATGLHFRTSTIPCRCLAASSTTTFSHITCGWRSNARLGLGQIMPQDAQPSKNDASTATGLGSCVGTSFLIDKLVIYDPVVSEIFSRGMIMVFASGDM